MGNLQLSHRTSERDDSQIGSIPADGNDSPAANAANTATNTAPKSNAKTRWTVAMANAIDAA